MANRCNQVMYDFTKILFRKMEAFLTPILDDNGFVSVQKMTENGIQIPDFIMPDATFRPIDLYRIFSPVVRKIKGSLT